MADAVEEFARRILKKYEGVMDADAAQCAYEDLDAGEFEVGAISAVEIAPVNDDEIDELLKLSKERFDWPLDVEIAARVAEKARQRLRAVS